MKKDEWKPSSKVVYLKQYMAKMVSCREFRRAHETQVELKQQVEIEQKRWKAMKREESRRKKIRLEELFDEKIRKVKAKHSTQLNALQRRWYCGPHKLSMASISSALNPLLHAPN